MAEHLRANWLDRVYGAKDSRDLERAYDEWAASYDADVHQLGYLLRAVSTGYIGRYIARDSKTLDAGAGTGLIGSYLKVMGFKSLTAIDLSEEMLNRARARGCYRDVHRMVLGEKLDFNTDTFDAAYAVGVFTEGHAPPSAFGEIARVVRPGGRFVFSIRDDVYQEMGYRDRLDSLEADGTWRLLCRSPQFQPYAGTRPDIQHRVFVYEVRTRSRA